MTSWKDLGDIVIHPNPGCGMSRNAPAMFRDAGIEPHAMSEGPAGNRGNAWAKETGR
ncbi:hypothetical protein SAMN05518801_10842 [Novosphingobium sp. CF614]|uniref:hypothetical protein n=1 Tax=Novosphingobium sp. CF614 TaxID=1884364 RepID=UPI0008E13D90|nr:hypothetical protein [Novosphingobium sp. CF614]SFG13786.1 hypothetical protein SAMN05518801_10842 [Novosphingobium sp. CF614]